MRALELRFLTTMAIVGACAFVAAKGSDIVSFSIGDSVAPQQSTAEIFKRWVAEPVLWFSARTAELTPVGADDASLVTTRRDEVMEILSVRPLSSEKWLSLLRIRGAAGEPSEKIAAALVMSALTGPNEGYLMSRRAIYGLSLWETMPAEVRRRAAIDTLAAPFSDKRMVEIQRLLASKPEKVRQEIKAALVEQGISRARLGEIGLASERQPSGS